jgi:2-iminobutanoate/2-iminopropanoate deaminase
MEAAGLVFCAGQVGIDPATRALVPGGAVAELDQALDNLAAVLATAGLGLDDLVKVTLYLVDLGDGAAINARWSERMPSAPPTRATVQVTALPGGGCVEIDAVAARR